MIKTDRLLLREFEIGDAAGLLELNSHPEVLKFTGDPPFDSLEQAQRFVETYDQYRLHGYGRWAVILKSNEEFIGW